MIGAMPTEAAEARWIGEVVDRHLGNVDLVLAEGFTPIHDRMVEVRRTGVPPKSHRGDVPVWLVLTDRPQGPREHHLDDIDGLVTLLLGLLDDQAGVTRAPSTS